MAFTFDVFPGHGLGLCQSGHREAISPGKPAEEAHRERREAGRTRRGDWVAYLSSHLPLLAGRDRSSDEGATGTDASCLDPDDDERIWTGDGRNQTPCKQSGCWTGVRPQLAGITCATFRCDPALNC